MNDASKLGPLWVSQLRQTVTAHRNRAAESLLTLTPDGDYAKHHLTLIDAANVMLVSPDLLAALNEISLMWHADSISLASGGEAFTAPAFDKLMERVEKLTLQFRVPA